ncbi:MAG: ribonuclease HI [Bacteroidia bacterium]
MKIIIYTDGSALGNPGKGGFGVVMRFGKHYKEISGGYRRTTNNRMELLAVITALESLKRGDIETIIHTDSQYVQRAITENWVFGWAKKNFAGKKNADLWRRFLAVYLPIKNMISFQWVKAHIGILDNERCDVLAKMAAEATDLEIDEVYEAENPA